MINLPGGHWLSWVFQSKPIVQFITFGCATTVTILASGGGNSTHDNESANRADVAQDGGYSIVQAERGNGDSDIPGALAPTDRAAVGSYEGLARSRCGSNIRVLDSSNYGNGLTPTVGVEFLFCLSFRGYGGTGYCADVADEDLLTAGHSVIQVFQKYVRSCRQSVNAIP